MSINFSKEATFNNEAQRLPNPETYFPNSIVELFRPDQNEVDHQYVQTTIDNLSPDQQATIYRNMTNMAGEVWTLVNGHEGRPSPEFLNSYMPSFVWAKRSDQLLPAPILPEADHQQVLRSRSFPLITLHESELIKNAKIGCLGLSTGLSPLVGLMQLGANHIEAVDPDVINVSNLNRIHGANIADVGTPKALHAARMLLGLNPYADIITHSHIFEENELETLLLTKDVVIEMIDHGGNKSQLREIQKKLRTQHPNGNIATIIMGTNTAWQAVISHETADDPLFLRPDLTDFDVAALHQTESPIAYLQSLIKVVGSQNIPTRQIINLMLQQQPEFRYLAQHGPNAMITGGILVRKIIAVLNHQNQGDEVALNLDNILGISNADEDKSLLNELQTHPSTTAMFLQFNSLDQAATTFCQQMGINWQPPHTHQ